MKKIIPIGLIWLALYLLTYSSVLAESQAQSARWGEGFRAEQCRGDMGFAAGWSLTTPIATFVELFASGFYEHGFQPSCSSKIAEKQ